MRVNRATTRKLYRQRQALDARLSGLAFSAIGAKLGISKSRAHALVQIALQETREKIAASADDLRAEEVARLDGMLEKLYPKAVKANLPAIDRVLKIGESRRKLLGLEAPVRIETTGRDGKPIEIASTLTIDPAKLSTQTLRELLDARTEPDGG